MSGEINPTHVDESFANSDDFHNVVAHGMWSGAAMATASAPMAAITNFRIEGPNDPGPLTPGRD